ncbi:hypothetical protein TNCV_2982901 [Trichonephila clavipes]|nr:hypothetical protein TNCV_2982901 [Trichonephila clavipes]
MIRKLITSGVYPRVEFGGSPTQKNLNFYHRAETFAKNHNIRRIARISFKDYLRTPKVLNLHLSFTLGFGWKRVAINSGPKEPKGHVKEKTREPVTRVLFYRGEIHLRIGFQFTLLAKESVICDS